MRGMAKKPELELHPDAWPRFERFIREVAKAGPQHRTATKSKAKRAKSPTGRKQKAQKEK
jgi:hypothetical protein